MHWGLTDGSAGMEAQVRGVLEALDKPFTLKRCNRRKPWCWLPGNWHYGALHQLDANSDPLQPPWPALVVSSGRRSAALALAIGKASGHQTKLVHLTDPRIAAQHFDMVVAMAHDPIKGANVLKTQWALHALTPQKLSLAATQFSILLGPYCQPRIAVLIGGSTHQYTLSPPNMQAMLQQLAAFQNATKCSLLITASRRTGAVNQAMLHEWAAMRPDNYYYDGTGENPYLGFLSLSDAIITTNDSVNMISEAAYSGKPLYILALPGHRHSKPAQFAEKLMAQGIARPLGLTLEQWEYQVVDERAVVAQRIAALLSKPTN